MNEFKPFAKTDAKKTADYRKLLKHHDWFSEYSDDHRVWQRASEEYNQIVILQSTLDPDYKIYNEYAPDEYKKESKNES